GRRLLGEVALEQRRDAAAELDHLESARNLAERVREHLPVLGREMTREILPVGVEELADAEEELRALRDREGAPRRERRLRRLDGGIDVFDAREIDGARLDAGRGVEDGTAPAGSPLAAGAADPVVDRPDGGRSVDQLGHLGKGSVIGVDSTLLELAEEPGLWLPPEPSRDVVVADGYCVVTYGRSVWVHRIRLAEPAVAQAV